VVFPLEILPIVSLLSALFHGMVSLGVWLLAYLIFFGLHLGIYSLTSVLIAWLGFAWFQKTRKGFADVL
jgi:lipopolysaccharide transport system permease protein